MSVKERKMPAKDNVVIYYNVWLLDSWGNAEEGWDVNDRSKVGTIALPKDASDTEIIVELKKHRYLSSKASEDDIAIGGDDMMITIDDAETGEPLYTLEVDQDEFDPFADEDAEDSKWPRETPEGEMELSEAAIKLGKLREAVTPKAKNPMGKMRPVNRPYEIWEAEGRDGKWEWRVLKAWQTDPYKPNARWFCAVKSPMTFGSFDMGDVYAADVIKYAHRVYRDPELPEEEAPNANKVSKTAKEKIQIENLDEASDKHSNKIDMSEFVEVITLNNTGDFHHSLALKSDGTVWAWGDNNYGQLGNGTYNSSDVPVKVLGLTGITKIAKGHYHSLALKDDGTVWAWGGNKYGQLGSWDNNESHVPVRVPRLTGVTAIASGFYHSLALKDDGTVWAWGYNNVGQLGDGTSDNSNVPVQVSGLTGITKIAGDVYYSLALKDDGTVWAWGGNYSGDNTINKVPVQVSDDEEQTLVSKLNEAREKASDEEVATQPNKIDTSEFVKVISPGRYTLALKDDGTVWAWGRNDYGQLGNGTNTDSNVPVQVLGLTDVTAIAGSFYYSLALKNDGTVWAWGYNGNGQLGNGTTTDSNYPVKVLGLTGITKIAVGDDHSLALKSNGTVWAWGWNRYGQLGNGTYTSSNVPVQVSGLTGVTAIAGGGIYSLALKNDGTVWTWGYNGDSQLGNGTTNNSNVPVQVSRLTRIKAVAVDDDRPLALKDDGTVWAWGHNPGNKTRNKGPVQVPDDKKQTLVNKLNEAREEASGKKVATKPDEIDRSEFVKVISQGRLRHTLALKNDGTVWAWGWNDYGQLGNGTKADSNVPVQVSGLTDVTAIAGGYFHSLALKSDGTVWAWGSNANGELGNGTDTDSNVPVQVSGLTGVTAIAGGSFHSLALKNDGTVWAWGDNLDGQLGDGTQDSSNIPVQVSGLTRIKAIAGDGDSSLALKDDGTVWAWGYNPSNKTINKVPVRVSDDEKKLPTSKLNKARKDFKKR
jgi:alpha-tubulin suppressor-like RCC1 family protein